MALDRQNTPATHNFKIRPLVKPFAKSVRRIAGQSIPMGAAIALPLAMMASSQVYAFNNTTNFTQILSTNNGGDWLGYDYKVLYGPYVNVADPDNPSFHMTGISAAVIKPAAKNSSNRAEEEIWAEARGYSHDSKDAQGQTVHVPMATDMVIDLASVSKAITAYLIARKFGTEISLGDSQVITLSSSTPLSDLLPFLNATIFSDAPKALEDCLASGAINSVSSRPSNIIANLCNNVTVGELLSHKSSVMPAPYNRANVEADLISSLRSYNGQQLIDWGKPLAAGREALINLGAPRLTAEGATERDFQYSNLGYQVLGLILVALEQQPFHKILTNAIDEINASRSEGQKITHIFADWQDIPGTVPVAHAWAPADGKQIKCLPPNQEGLALFTNKWTCIEAENRHNPRGEAYQAAAYNDPKANKAPPNDLYLSDGYHRLANFSTADQRRYRIKDKWPIASTDASLTSACYFYWRWWIGQPSYLVCFDHNALAMPGLIGAAYDDLTKEMETLNSHATTPLRENRDPNTYRYSDTRLSTTPIPSSGDMYGTPTDVARLLQETFWYERLNQMQATDRAVLDAAYAITSDAEGFGDLACRKLVGKGGKHTGSNTFTLMDVDTGIAVSVFQNSASLGDFGFTVQGGIGTMEGMMPDAIPTTIAAKLLHESLAQQMTEEQGAAFAGVCP